MTGIVIPDGGTIGSASDTDAISVASNGEVTVNQSIKATAIKHTNGTSAITINSDGSLSGKFEGAMKFVQIGRPSSGNPTDTNKVWITFGITSGYHEVTNGYGYMGFGFGQPVAILTYNTGTSSWNAWSYINPSITSAHGAGTLSGSTNTDGSSSDSIYNTSGFTYTIEMDKV